MTRIKKGVKQSRLNLKAAREKKKKQTPSVDARVTSSESPPPPSVSPPPPSLSPSPSSVKRKNLLTKESDIPVVTQENVLVKKQSLEELASNVCCPECFENMKCIFTRKHADSSFKIVCTKCSYIAKDTAEDHKSKEKGIYEITIMIVYAVMLLGYRYSGFEKLCSLLSMRHVSFRVYRKYASLVTKCAIEETKSLLETSRKAVIQYYGEVLKRFPDKDGILDIDVTYDGSWHTRGHKSLLGVGAVVDANSGLVVDFHTVSKLCVMCTRMKTRVKKKIMTQKAFDEWKTKHAPRCDVNHEGSSASMEAAAAMCLWNRSLSHSLRYVNFISDGDSSSFKAVTALSDGNGPYGKKHTVKKEECVNHVSKRLGTALRNLKQTPHFTEEGGKRRKIMLGGHSRLTDSVINRLTYYFGISVRRRADTTPEEMRNDIMSSFYHCSSTDENPKHNLCPKSEESWCFYQKALSKGNTPPSHSTMKIKFRLDPEGLRLVEDVYKRLTTDDMMTRCLRGKTQNPNESLHHRIWRYCPKHKNATKEMLDFATAQAVSNFNGGYLSSDLCSKLGVAFTDKNYKYLTKENTKMDRPIKKKIRSKQLQKDLEAYASGAH